MKDSLITMDPAQYGNPVSEVFKKPTSVEEWEQYILDKKQMRFLEEDGYISVIK